MPAFPFELIFNIFVIGILFIYWIATFIILYHLTRFGIGVQPKKFAAIFLFGSAILSCLAIFLYTKVDINLLIPR